jgi:membrane protease YdiL (CAAX protease family)
MQLFADDLTWNPIVPAAILAVTACAGVWAMLAARWRQGRPAVPYQPRRRAPWGAWELVLIVAFYVMAYWLTFALAGAVFGAGPASGTVGQVGNLPHDKESTAAHVVAQLLAENNVWVLLLCVVAAAIVAPVAEEFFFRVLLQGWLEARERRWRRWLRVSRGVVPIVPTALIFAAMHFRRSAPPASARELMLGVASNTVASIVALAFAIAWLRQCVGATAADFGWTPRKLWGDIVLGLAAFGAIAAPLYVMQLAFRLLLPESIAPDPLPLFFFALVLGILYYRTHRIVPLVVLHAALNATSLVLTWLGP